MAPVPSSAAKVPTLAQLERQANQQHLTITAALGTDKCATRDDLPPGTQTLLMLSPDEPRFWPMFIDTPEYRDGQPDPMDRWSRRVIDALAAKLGATPLYPFGGPPFQPFIGWALASGFAHSSPVGMLVHDRAGLFLSFRGALALSQAIDVPAPGPSPCTSCADRPCLTACPVSALGGAGYDTKSCKSYLVGTPDNDCMSSGCRARRACPIGKSYGRVEAHSAYHMSQFS
ncbi:ferredoxin [Pseudooceanicola sp. MF1-13]|uniref:ferredoxin n=1 Tax=Pseudooceanicola sp. MF1-13 TaxID=3379095 RepID=UPI0038929D22